MTKPEPNWVEVREACKSMNRRVGNVEYMAEVFTILSERPVKGSDGRLCWQPHHEPHVRFLKGGKVVFDIWASSLERVRSHWGTFLEVNNAKAPKVGARVRVKTGPGRVYTAKVLEVSRTRVLAQWRYVAGHRSAPRWFRLCDIWW
jgi:hypothetical protein